MNLTQFFFENYKNSILKPSLEELVKNSPSRSAKLRYAVRNSNEFFIPKKFKDKFKKYVYLEAVNE